MCMYACTQPSARSFLFAADAPTTTTQRLKALATGGLPSFFDVGNSFSAGAVEDDSLLHQLADAGGRKLVRERAGCTELRGVEARGPRPAPTYAPSPSLPCPALQAFLGDTTWQQLFPTQWAWSRPYPCFNVRDLHTVDDGVWRHLMPALRQPGGSGGGGNASDADGGGTGAWDVLVAHYLGVDHCGHTHGVASPEMVLKLRRADGFRACCARCMLCCAALHVQLWDSLAVRLLSASC